MEHILVALHVFVAVLVLGTIWRLASLHAMASPNEFVQHLGRAMTLQY